MKGLLTQLWTNNRRFALYCVIGLTGTALDFSVYFALVKWAAVHYQIANAAGYAAGTVLSFTLNAMLNFKTRDRLPLRFLSFCTVAFLGWSSSAGILFFTVRRLGMDRYLAKILTIFVAVVLQYNLNRLFSFRKADKPTEAAPSLRSTLSPE